MTSWIFNILQYYHFHHHCSIITCILFETLSHNAFRHTRMILKKSTTLCFRDLCYIKTILLYPHPIKVPFPIPLSKLRFLTLCNVRSITCTNIDIVKSFSIFWIIRISAATFLYHITLVTSLETRLEKFKRFVPSTTIKTA